MRRSSIAAGLLLALLSGTALAEMQPFDMAPEQPSLPGVEAQLSPADISASPGVDPTGVSSTETVTYRRFLLPDGDFVMSGETARRAWTVSLTREQAAAPASLRIGYRNAIMVAPELSRLTLTVNGTVVIDTPIGSPEAVTDVMAQLPPGLLRPGQNDVSIAATQRHRTDCTIQSTFELWTELDPARTGIDFAGADAGRLQRVEDLHAIGVDASGGTTVDLVVPTLDSGASTAAMMRLAQGIGLITAMPSQAISVTREDPGTGGSGHLTVMMGTETELRGMTTLPPGAEAGPVAGFVQRDDGRSVLVVSGPNWQAIGPAVETVIGAFGTRGTAPRTTLGTQSWRSPDVPVFPSASSRSFAELGVQTQEFDGRRFRTDFAIGIPSDFYADAYGEATILLDAAYSAEVQPGSHIDVYVNDHIAATVPVTTRKGEILRQLPIKVAMRHMKPGVNTIAIETVQFTQADATCAPGATGRNAGRFVIFDSSRFEMPRFGRIGRLPNLSGLAGTGFPYGRSTVPIPLILDGTKPETLSAAATILARLAVAAGRPLPVETGATPAAAAGRDAIIIGAVGNVPADILAQVGVSETSRTRWGEGEAMASERQPTRTDDTFDAWRDRLSGSGWRGQVGGLKDWLDRNFDFSSVTLSLIPGPPVVFSPPGNATAMLAQQMSPSGRGAWTVVTAPTPSMLKTGARSLVQQANWNRIGGQISTFDPVANEVVQVQPATRVWVQTQPASFANYRFILSNWLSDNVLVYSVLLVIICVVLGFFTSIMLSTLGRKR